MLEACSGYGAWSACIPQHIFPGLVLAGQPAIWTRRCVVLVLLSSLVPATGNWASCCEHLPAARAGEAGLWEPKQYLRMLLFSLGDNNSANCFGKASFKKPVVITWCPFPVLSMELLPWVVMGPLVPIFIVKLSSVWFQCFFSLTPHAFPGPEELDLSRPVLHHPVHASLWVCTCLQFIKVSFKWIGRCERQKLFSTFWIIGGVSGT